MNGRNRKITEIETADKMRGFIVAFCQLEDTTNRCPDGGSFEALIQTRPRRERVNTSVREARAAPKLGIAVFKRQLRNDLS